MPTESVALLSREIYSKQMEAKRHGQPDRALHESDVESDNGEMWREPRLIGDRQNMRLFGIG